VQSTWHWAKEIIPEVSETMHAYVESKYPAKIDRKLAKKLTQTWRVTDMSKLML
jgi:hypothetical protein